MPDVGQSVKNVSTYSSKRLNTCKGPYLLSSLLLVAFLAICFVEEAAAYKRRQRAPLCCILTWR
jgi:hypothetical protein